MKIGVVGDLSGGDPARLCTVLDNALIACDYVVQVGDLDPAYEQVKSRWLTSGHKFFPVPGNHDLEYDTIGCDREWTVKTPDGLATLVGIDNSGGYIGDAAKQSLAGAIDTPYTFVFAHMAPCAIVLPDGTLNYHGMLESGSPDDAAWLTAQLDSLDGAMVAGHYHGWTLQQTSWGTLIVDGRGGAAPDLAYTLITVTADGWVVYSVGLG